MPPTRTATLNPLLIPELFQCVLDNLTIPEKGSISVFAPQDKDRERILATLVALARTCYALSEPSLDRLWRRLDSFRPLIRCFVPISVDWKTVGCPTPAQWESITRCARRVRELSLPSNDIRDKFFLESALSFSPSPFLFPNLMVLTWSVSPCREDAYLTTNMHRLLPSNLVSLSVILGRGHGIDSFLRNYLSLCPDLKLKSASFDIYQSTPYGGKVTLSEIRQLSQAICIHDHLDTLELSIPIDYVALRHVMLSSRLRVVSLVLHPMESNLDDIGFTSADTPFRNVKDLELVIWDLQFVSGFLRPEGQMFSALRLRLNGLHGAKIVFAFLTALASPQRTRSLQSIQLTLGNFYTIFHQQTNIPYRDDIHRLTYDILQPLTHLKHLRELRLLPSNQIFLSDEELAALTGNWPMLEVLQLNCNNGCYGTSITLRGLLSVLSLCPRLHELGLSLDAREVPKQTGAVNVCIAILTSLSLPDSPIHDAHQVMEFFSRHLPSVTYVDVYFITTPSVMYRPPPEYEPLWAKVNEYLQGDREGVYP